MNTRKSIISVLVTLAILICSLPNTYATDSDKLIMELKVGSNLAKAYGITTSIEKPFIKDNSIMVPLAWFTTTIGAEVIWKENFTVEIIYQEFNAELKIGSTRYKSNSDTKNLSAAPVIKNNRTMIPLDFISDNFPVTITSDKKSGNVKIILDDDGALIDLSFLTGGITNAAVGNSYYGWSLNVPSGSRIISNSFKSDVIGITNESRSLYFEICAENKNGRKLDELYNELSDLGPIRKSEINLKADIPYIQYSRLTEYEEALRVKVFDKGEYFYYVTINCYDNTTTPEKLMSDKYFNNIINSFNLNYKGNTKGVQDLSKVQQGRVSFYNYIRLDTETKYMPWSINIPVKWNQILKNIDPLTTNLGIDSRHYMKITVNTLDEVMALEDYVYGIKDKYDKYFNPKVYNFISSDSVIAAGTDAINLKFSIKQADNVYIIDEFYFIKNGLVYEISIKLPEKEYEKQVKQYTEAIDNITFYDIDKVKYLSDLEIYQSKNLQVPVSEKDDLFEYTNKLYNWSAQIPGYWTKSGYEGGSSVTFDNPNTNAYIMINVIENNTYTQNLTDEEKLSFLQLLIAKYGANPQKSTTTNANGYEVRKYEYNITDQEQDLYLDVISYWFEQGENTYNFTAVVPELTATEDSLKEIDNIWKSFKLIK